MTNGKKKIFNTKVIKWLKPDMLTLQYYRIKTISTFTFESAKLKQNLLNVEIEVNHENNN